MSGAGTATAAVAVVMSDELKGRLFSPAAWDRLAKAADVRRSLSPDVLAVITGWDTPPLTDADLAACPWLRLVAHTGGSVRALVPESAYDRGIQTSQAAAVLAEGVAEFAVMQIIAGLRRAYDFAAALRSGTPWDELAARPPGRLLRHQVVGIVGASRAGRATLRRLRPFGCRILLYDPYVGTREAAELGAESSGLDDLLRRSDVVSLHAPVLPETRGMLDRRRLALLPDGAVLVNTARAALVDGAALLAEIETGRLSALLDVFDEEPLPDAGPWRSTPGVVATPHIAALTTETLHEQGDAAVEEVLRLLADEPLLHAISRESYRVIA